jgi:hypothetical protein
VVGPTIVLPHFTDTEGWSQPKVASCTSKYVFLICCSRVSDTVELYDFVTIKEKGRLKKVD